MCSIIQPAYDKNDPATLDDLARSGLGKVSNRNGASTMSAKVATGTGGMAVTHHHLATEAALEVMAAGGTAVDAAIAANAVVGVVLPTACGMGGDLFAIVHKPGDPAPAALNASGRAGSGVDAERLRRAGQSGMPYRGSEAITIPGCVDGWVTLSERFGRLHLADVLQPAIVCATQGFRASTELAASLEAIRSLIAEQPAAVALYPEGRPPLADETIVRPDLAATLEEVAQGGRHSFYEGTVGEAITRVTQGRITAEDLARSSADWVEPAGIDLFGRRAWTVPPNSQGYLALAAAWVVEQLAPPRDFDDPRYTHLLVEASRAVEWEREDLVADPDFAPLSAKELLDPDRLRPRLEQISPERRADWPSAHQPSGGTTYLCVIDAEGMGVSLIQSNFAGIGCGLSAGDSGVFLQNRGAGFNLIPGHPNELAPGKRPLHTLSPTLWTRDGRLDLLLGTRGGYWQPQILLQVASHLLYLEKSPAEAQDLPRWTLDADRLRAERGLPSEGLVQRGHLVKEVGPQIGWGPVSLIAIGENGTRTGAAEPRIDTASVGS
jgi:gamma-glutamyltranspeptidase/glutathione hydrolase